MTRESDICLEGGNVHAHEGCGLDVNAAGVLVTVRRCVWCGRQQEKPYGAGGRRSWRAHKPAPREDAPSEEDLA